MIRRRYWIEIIVIILFNKIHPFLYNKYYRLYHEYLKMMLKRCGKDVKFHGKIAITKPEKVELGDNSGKVIAIETDPVGEKYKEKSLGNTHVVPKAVWTGKGMMSLHRSYKQANTSVQDVINQNIVNVTNNTVHVQTDTIDNILDDLGINEVTLISLTINGAELEAIEGMSKTLETYSPRLSIAGWYLRDGLPIWEKAIPLLKEKRYETVKGIKRRVISRKGGMCNYG